jgi:hypothetical protein
MDSILSKKWRFVIYRTDISKSIAPNFSWFRAFNRELQSYWNRQNLKFLVIFCVASIHLLYFKFFKVCKRDIYIIYIEISKRNWYIISYHIRNLHSFEHITFYKISRNLKNWSSLFFSNDPAAWIDKYAFR